MRQERCKYILLCLLALCGCTQEKKPEDAKKKAVPVTVETVSLQNIPLYIETIGTIRSPRIVRIRPQVSGKLLKIHVKPGEYVKKGELLYTIDPRPYRAALELAEANLVKDKANYNFAKKKVERYKDLAKREYISQLSFDEYQRDAEAARALVKKDEAEVVLKKIDLEYCTIRSPIEGRISHFDVDPGNIVHPGDTATLTEIRQFSPIRVQFTIPQRDFQEVQRYERANQLRVQLFLPHESDEKDDLYEGKIFFVDNHIDTTTGTICLKGEIENQDHMLWPGQFVRVRLMMREKEQALVLPNTAVHYRQEGPFVFVVEPDDTVSLRAVTLAEKLGDRLIIKEGLKEGEQVVIEGHHNLYAGRKVRK